MISRCQRFDLSRIKSSKLFEFIKKIKEKEGGKVSDDALRLIVKISEGSVRDSLSLLDRALLTLDSNKELDLKSAQNIFGFFDKSQLIELFEFESFEAFTKHSSKVLHGTISALASIDKAAKCE